MTIPFIKPSLNLDFINARRLDSRITFTRASSGTYFNEFGVLVTAPANVPRFDYDPTTGESLGLLIEEQRTNLLTYSEQFVGNWSPSPAGCVSIIADQEVAPDGTTTMAKVVTDDTLTNGHIAFRTFTGAPNTTYNFSMFFKKAELPLARLWFGNTGFASTNHGAAFDLDAGSIAFVSATAIATMQYVGNDIYRCSVTATSDSDGGNYVCAFGPAPAGTLLLGNYTSPGIGLGVYAWGAQIETGAFPTSYIKTEASQVTRAADNAVMTGTNFSNWFNPTEGTLFTWANCNEVYAGTDRFPPILEISDGTNNEVIRIIERRLTGNNNDLIFAVRDGNVAQASFQLNTADTNVGQFYKIAAAYKLNDFAGSFDGNAAVTDLSGTIPTVTQARIGSGWTGILNGHIKHLAYYPRRLSDIQLQALTG